MNDEVDKAKICEVIETWMTASAAGDVAKVLTLMAEDVVFLLPGQDPMKGRQAFAAAMNANEGKVLFEGKSEVQDIKIAGDYAFTWTHLTISIAPVSGGAAKKRAGPVLSVFRKEPDGRWVIFRDANMLTP